jgi:cellulose synthase/poly-beta-1,6-N-acetylglucosamine synthase-like glycosyltransferase
MTEIGSTSPRPRCSVVITAHNERAAIADCLRSLDRQRGFAPGDLEIILVDDRSTDGTAGAAAAVDIDGLTILTIDDDGRYALTTRQRALDLGFAAASGATILTLDADGIAPAEWAFAMAAPIERGKVEAVVGAVAFVGPHLLIAALQTVDVAVYLQICRILSAWRFESGGLFGNFAFKAGLYEEVGGFRNIGFALTEDLSFVRAIQRKGCRLKFLPDAAVTVNACRRWKDLIERARRVSAGGWSALSAVIGVWYASLAVLAVLALGSWDRSILLAAIVRYVAGVATTAAAVVAARRFRLLPVAFIYEPLAIMIAVLVLLRLLRNRAVRWGGVDYRR